jgi:hypothetical protein
MKSIKKDDTPGEGNAEKIFDGETFPRMSQK